MSPNTLSLSLCPTLLLLLLLTTPSTAATPQTCTIASGQTGVCISTSTCASGGGVPEAGHCPGSSDVQCCTYGPCAAATLSGLCVPNTTCAGTSWGGYCGGDATIQCCTLGACSAAGNVPGQCGLASLCAADGGTSTGGLCPGSATVKCCTYGTCAAGGKSGFCQTKGSCPGTSTPGLCPGGDEIQCCTPGTGTVDGGPCGALTVDQATLELIKGFEGWFPDICRFGVSLSWKWKRKKGLM